MCELTLNILMVVILKVILLHSKLIVESTVVLRPFEGHYSMTFNFFLGVKIILIIYYIYIHTYIHIIYIYIHISLA